MKISLRFFVDKNLKNESCNMSIIGLSLVQTANEKIWDLWQNGSIQSRNLVVLSPQVCNRSSQRFSVVSIYGGNRNRNL